jgi:thioredoxin-dependent peroxiredoxin
MTLFSIKRSNIRPGDSLPEVIIPDDRGNDFNTANLKDKWYVLYFYPKDNTPGCTRQCKGFSMLTKEFEEAGAEVIGISRDKPGTHQEFRKKHNLTHRLLSDRKGKFAIALGVRILFGMCSRDTIVVNTEGKIDRIFRGVNPSANPGQVLDYLKLRVGQ